MGNKKRRSLESATSSAMFAQREADARKNYIDRTELLANHAAKNKTAYYAPAEDLYIGGLPEIEVSATKRNKNSEIDRGFIRVSNPANPESNITTGYNDIHARPININPDADFAVLGGLQLGTSIAKNTAKYAYNVGKQIFDPYERVGHVMSTLEPFGYSIENFQNVIPEIKTILKGKSSDFTKSEWHNKYINSKFAPYLNRIEAYKLWGRRTPSSKVYIKNSDGTYSYNLRSLKENNLFSDRDFEIAKDYMIDQGWGADMITGNGGNIGIKLKDPNTIHIEDIWDLHPFQDIRLFTNISRNISKKLPDKISDKLIKYSDKLDNKLKDVEVSPLLGGKPFTLSQDIPVIKNNGHYFVDWSKIKRNGGRKSLRNYGK